LAYQESLMEIIAPLILVIGLISLGSLLAAIGLVYIPHNKVGIIEKLWSKEGSLAQGQIVAMNKEAGFQSELLRGGLHFGFFPWQYRVHKVPLVLVSEGRIAYVYARDGRSLSPDQTLGQVVDCNFFQDTRGFLSLGGQRGRQRAILREGLYAVNTALFVVITEDEVYPGPIKDQSAKKYQGWQADLSGADGFLPIVIGHRGRPVERSGRGVGSGAADLEPTDTIGVVTIHDGPSIPSGEIIAPEVKGKDDAGHSYFQNPDLFLGLGGRRGMQLQVLTNGTFFLNRWFATVEMQHKTLIPIGYVGVVVSYYGVRGEDVTGQNFRYGEQVDPGQRGVWKRALPPGKYPLNPYAVKVEPVPTVNFVLRWITGQSEAHCYDADLRSIEMITADGYEPNLPLSLVLHIDYEKASRVVQRFGDVKRLISQTLDPILSSYFRDIAQGLNMLDLLTKRDEIQQLATKELGRRFSEYDINCIAVLIGRPESQHRGQGVDPITKLFDQLRIRRLAKEQVDTFEKQQQAALKLRDLRAAQAAADKQSCLTETKIAIEISENRGRAELAEARCLAERDVVRAEGESKAKDLFGRGEASRIAKMGQAEAAVFQQKIQAYGDPKLFALNKLGEHFANSQQPLVPERMLISSGPSGSSSGVQGLGVLGQFLTLLLAEKSGLDWASSAAPKNGHGQLPMFPGSLEEDPLTAAECLEKIGELKAPE
jgi:uncharacterized membrane protein YqiK